MKRYLPDFAVASSLAAAVAVFLPLSSYLCNAALFPFSLGRLLPELLGLFTVFTAGLFLLVWSFRKLSDAARPESAACLRPLRFLGRFPALLTAVLVCVYLESGPLSFGIPELNGGPVTVLSDRTRILSDIGVWTVVIVLFVACARRLAPILHWIALAVLVLFLASLADVRSPARDYDGSEKSSFFQPQPTVVANVRYSPVRNVLVFVLDSMPGASTLEAIGENGALLSKFPGFTAYPQNVGMHECTKRGVPGLVTGLHYDPVAMSEADYPMTMYATNSVVLEAEVAGWTVAFSPDLLPYGYTNIPVERRVERVEKRRSRDRIAFLRQSTEVPYLSLFDMVAFRLAPFPAKGPILYSRIRHAVKGRHEAGSFWSERTMYPILASRPVSTDARPFLGVFHSWGVHPPWEGDFAAAAAGALGRLGTLFDALRASGVYDRSLIVVTSDHGLDQASPVGAFPPSASALLWVKPEGASAPFAVSSERTSHARIAPLVRAALAGPLAADACAGTLRAERRLYRAEVREGVREYFRDWEDRP